MWSNISAPKSGLKTAQVGQQTVKHEEQAALDQQENNRDLCNPFNTSKSSSSSNNFDSPLMRYKHAVCSSQNSGFIYIHGGRFANGVPLDDDVWRFDAHENRWLQLKTGGPCKPPSLQEHTLSEYQEQLFLFGGQVSAASGQENFFWRLDLATNEWRSLNMEASSANNCSSLRCSGGAGKGGGKGGGGGGGGVRLGPTNRRGHSACVYRDSIYIFGGYEDFRGSTNQLWQYDLLNERWELRNLSSLSACHPEPRHNHSAIIYQDNMFIYGGLSNLKPLGDLWRWSWREKRWFRERTRGQSPGQLHGHTAIQAFGSMFVFGGERQNGSTTRSLWRLNLSNLCWQKIKPKGPRPNPTTWHAAIANPLGILDEANYLIEGDASSDLELEQQRHQDEQLTLVVNQGQANCPSDNCFSTTMQQQRTIPLELVRPLAAMPDKSASDKQQRSHHKALITNGNHHHHHNTNNTTTTNNNNNNSTRPLKLSKSQSDQMSCFAAKQAALQSRVSVAKTKRKLRLSFLRRNGAKKVAETGVRSSIPISQSAVTILDASSSSCDTSVEAQQNAPVAVLGQALGGGPERHSVAIVADREQHRSPSGDVEMRHSETLEGRETNVAILDSLDTDIKCMFQRAMSPSGEAEQDDELPNEARPVRDSMTQSQLSSYMGPTSTTQTYQTARDRVDSQSTLTITADEGAMQRQPQQSHNNNNHHHHQRPVASSRLADVRQRRSVHQFNQSRNRPKSEIVQSLIDRADARIKHLYTPYFNPEQQHHHNQQHHSSRRASGQFMQPSEQAQPARAPTFSSLANDPVLGELANHRMFDRSSLQTTTTSTRRTSTLDKSKRHTIHQTMTYYNLYFAEDRLLESSSGGDSSNSPPAASNDHQNGKTSPITSPKSGAGDGSATSGVNEKSSQSGSNSNTTNCNSTTAALVGVHDGVSRSSGGGGGDNLSQRTIFLGKLESEVGSLMQSSDSRTLCADLEDETDQAGGAISFRRRTENQRRSNRAGGGCEQQQQQQQQQHQSDENGLIESNQREFRANDDNISSNNLNDDDNTSLSFSVIAEFEEDDMLQYSSPTDLVMMEGARRAGREHDDGDSPMEGQSDETSSEGAGPEVEQVNRRGLAAQHAAQAKRESISVPDPSAPHHHLRMQPQKSTSSGYDSIRSTQSPSNASKHRAQCGQRPENQGDYSATSSAEGSPRAGARSAMATTMMKQDQQAAKREHHTATTTTATTTASSTTAESLALTTTNTSECCPLTPPSLRGSLPSSPPDLSQTGSSITQTGRWQHSSFASSLMSGPSRLFGRRKSTKTRYWQLCMFVIGGKQQGGHHTTGNLNEPIAIWRLYI